MQTFYLVFASRARMWIRNFRKQFHSAHFENITNNITLPSTTGNHHDRRSHKKLNSPAVVAHKNAGGHHSQFLTATKCFSRIENVGKN